MLHFLMSTYNGDRDFWSLPNGGGEAQRKRQTTPTRNSTKPTK
ncbi:MAG: hypothetical protein ACO4CS_16090 [bacterium]